MSAVFDARYPGRCASCDGRINEGDQVTYVDDELVHTECTDDPASPCRPPVLVDPLTGEDSRDAEADR